MPRIQWPLHLVLRLSVCVCSLYERYAMLWALFARLAMCSVGSSHQLVSSLALKELSRCVGRDRLLPVDTNEGDCILVATAGAYGRCMSSFYNLRAPAKEIVLK